ncbi:hypothetical protein G3A_07160 [Bacillus sp. 17376]|nr:hypothetical protein G3A_07160 [Bacillus sp. 17376]
MAETQKAKTAGQDNYRPISGRKTKELYKTLPKENLLSKHKLKASF